MRLISSLKTSVIMRRVSILTGVLAVVVFVRTSGSQQIVPKQWQVVGNDLVNSRNQADEHVIGTANVASLTNKWIATTGSDVSATPMVDAEAVYVPDWSGHLYAFHKDN